MNRRFDTPNWLISIANKSRELEDWVMLRGVYRALLNPIHGANSPAFKMIRWPKPEQIVDINDEPAELPVVEPDDGANILTSVIYRLKKQAVVVTASRVAMGEILGSYKNGQPAVALTYRGVPRAGVLPNGLEDYGYLPESDMYSAALREGRSEFGAGLGVWLDDERTIVVPKDNRIAEQHVATNELSDRYPGTTLV